MNRTSWAKHLKSLAHTRAIQHVAEAWSQQAATHQQYNELTPSTSLNATVMPPDLGPGRRPQFRPILNDKDTNGISAADFQEIIMQENTEALRREIEILQLQHLETEFEGADDENYPSAPSANPSSEARLCPSCRTRLLHSGVDLSRGWTAVVADTQTSLVQPSMCPYLDLDENWAGNYLDREKYKCIGNGARYTTGSSVVSCHHESLAAWGPTPGVPIKC
ncbi:hypothetical protein C8J57DRAFT_1535214 [Mycena rebaudengoi]|nr:hypothetical protein C8J57DRAFT_1535214 [Mycena rebaudengoi]